MVPEGVTKAQEEFQAPSPSTEVEFCVLQRNCLAFPTLQSLFGLTVEKGL